jgi:hypothetical protein
MGFRIGMMTGKAIEIAFPIGWPTGTENLHFMLSGETRRAPRPPVASSQTAWEDADQESFAIPRYSHRQAWTRAA